MAFNPTSTIYMGRVDFDNTYKNQVRFTTGDPSVIRTRQYNHFKSKLTLPFTQYLTVRKTLPNGSLQSSVKVNANIDDLYGCNYMMYKNANHGTRWFYAFITKLVYVNEGTTEVVFETDVWQTWYTDITIKPSFVLREHSLTDNIGDNLVPESIAVNDFHYVKLHDALSDLGQWGYLIACTEKILVDAKVSPSKHSGIYQGLYFYYFTNPIHINEMIERLNDKGLDSIVSITAIPEFSVKHAKMEWRRMGQTDYEDYDDIGLISGTDYPNEKTYSYDVSVVTSMDGYSSIKNNKLWTAPYFTLIVTNNSGDTREYIIEDFKDRNNIVFTLYGDISTNPSLLFTPKNYKNVNEESNEDDVYGENTDFGISIGGFPQCAFINDYYKLWSAKNSGQQAINSGVGVVSTILGAILAGTGHPIAGVGMITSGVSAVAGAINKSSVASDLANPATVGSPRNNLLTAMKRNRFDVRIKTLKHDQAESIDNYFTMYGYQTNKLKVPNIYARSHYSYVQTSECNIVGGIPDDDMQKLKSMFNNGVTFWESTTTVGNYDVNNRCD